MSLSRLVSTRRLVRSSIVMANVVRVRSFTSSPAKCFGDRIMPNNRAQSPSDIRWFEKWDKQLHPTDNKITWIVSGTTNVTFHALDKHVQDGKGAEIALAFTDDMTGKDMKYSYQELYDMTTAFSRRLLGLGITKDDVVMVYDPKLPQAVVAMLSCARIGALYSMVFGGASPELLSQRINLERPKAIISASCGLQVYYDVNSAAPYKPIIEKALSQAHHHVEHVILYQRDPIRCDVDGKKYVDWNEPSDHQFNPLFAAASSAGIPYFVNEPVLNPKYEGELGPVAHAAQRAGLPVFVPY
jgi:hypothetical protein